MKREATIRISLDETPCEVLDGTTLADLVSSLGHAPNAVTTAVGGVFVARSERAAHRLQAGDAVLLFKPIVGG